MTRSDLENILKFAKDNNLMQERIEDVYKMWKNSK